MKAAADGTDNYVGAPYMPIENGSRRTRVLLVDDSALVRQALKDLIAREEDMTVCGEADDQEGALAAVAETKPELAIIDLRLRGSDGLELIREIHRRHPETRILVLSMSDEALYAEEAIRAGASGYISKLEATTKLMGAMRRVLYGEIYRR
jgi:DNA-binding NarL/FixJ family response regulator